MRKTARGIEKGTYLSVRRQGRRRDFGWAVAPPRSHPKAGMVVEYRSAMTGNTHTVSVTLIRIERALEKRRKTAQGTAAIPPPQPKRRRRAARGFL